MLVNPPWRLSGVPYICQCKQVTGSRQSVSVVTEGKYLFVISGTCCHPSSSIFSCSGQSRTLELICYKTGPFSFSTYLFREKYVKTKHTLNARKHYKRLSSHMYQNFSLTEAQTFNKLYFLANSVCTVDCRLVSFRSTIVIN